MKTYKRIANDDGSISVFEIPRYFAIRPHREAPDFTSVEASQKRIIDLFNDITGAHPTVGLRSTLDMMRQAGLVNLWFYLKVIAGFSGPYSDLDDTLNLDMCNWRQSDSCMAPGARFIALMPRGFRKCECFGEIVYTENRGAIPVERLCIGDRIQSITEDYRTTYSEITGKSFDNSRSVRVKLLSGRTKNVADYHRFKTLWGWKAATDLKVGDRIAIARKRQGETCYTDRGYFIGLLMGDGSLVGNSSITTFDNEIVDWVREYWPESSYNKSLGRVHFRKLNIPKEWRKLSYDKFIPHEFERDSGMLRGLFDTDGWVGKALIGYCTVSKRLAYDVMRNLSYFGVYASVYIAKTPSPFGKAYIISITGQYDMKLFLDKIGFNILRKKNKLKEALGKVENGNYKVNIPPEWKTILDDLPEGTKFALRKKRIRIDNDYSTGVNKVRKVLDELGLHEFDYLVDNDIAWDVVSEVSSIGSKPIVHIEVSGIENYIGNDNIVNHNSTCFTHGPMSWKITRDSEVRIRCVNAIISRAEGFKYLAQRTIDSNPLYAALYGPGWTMPDGTPIPSRVPLPNAKHWNDEEMVIPTRKKFAPEPTIKSAGVTGSGEGDHHTDLAIDDPIGLDAVDWQYQATVMMENAKKWMNTNLTALLILPKRDIIGISGTRYADDDCYAPFVNDAKEVVGVMDEDVYPVPGGQWSVYYRLVQEEGQMLAPDIIDEKQLARLDAWTAALQYWNKPKNSGLNEFSKYVIKPCKLFHDTKTNLTLISFRDELTDRVVTLNAASLTGVISTDAAASDRNVSILTCRTSVAVHFMDDQNRDFRVWNKVGYFSMDQTFEAIFEAWNLFPGLIQATLFETNAMQKGLYQLLQKEQDKRKTFISLREAPAKGDKMARIRAVVGWFFAQGLIYSTPEASIEFTQEKDAFPSKHLDVLDETEKALSYMKRPANVEEMALANEAEVEHMMELAEVDNCFGY
jgi:intein/homing endonuclease